eukprot:5801834-Amphidinium_carterae.1
MRAQFSKPVSQSNCVALRLQTHCTNTDWLLPSKRPIKEPPYNAGGASRWSKAPMFILTVKS